MLQKINLSDTSFTIPVSGIFTAGKIHLIETALTFAFGITILLLPQSSMKAFTIALGTYLLFDGSLTAITGQN